MYPLPLVFLTELKEKWDSYNVSVENGLEWGCIHNLNIDGYRYCSHINLFSELMIQEGVEIYDEYESVRQEVERLTATGVNKIIALGTAKFSEDLKIAEIEGIDVVIGGENRLDGVFMWTGLSSLIKGMSRCQLSKAWGRWGTKLSAGAEDH